MTKKHVWLMVLCCLVPLVGLAIVVVFDARLNTGLFAVLVLFCPLSHVLMMFMPGHDQAAHQSSQTEK